MALRDGTYPIGPPSGRLLLKTGRTGLGSKAGHDLTLEATVWSGHVVVDMEHPEQSSVNVEVEVDSLEVREGTGGVKPLTDNDRAEIKRTIREKILRTDRHPTVTFRSAQVRGSAESFSIDGELTIMGTTRMVTVDGAVGDDNRARGASTVTQTDYGIKPYSAFLGALKLADDVTVEFDVAFASDS